MLRALLLASAAAAVAVAGVVPVSLTQSGSTLALANGFVRVVVDLQRGSFDVIQGRLEGDGDFTASPNLAPNLASAGSAGGGGGVGGMALPPSFVQGAIAAVAIGSGPGLAGVVALGETSTSSVPLPSPANAAILSNSSDLGAFSLTLQDGPGAPRIAATLTLSLAAGSRSFALNASVTTLRAFNATAVVLRTLWAPASAVATYSTGVRQGMSQRSPFLVGLQPWTRFMGVGWGGAVDIAPANSATGSASTILFAGFPSDGARSGLDLVLGGKLADNGWLDGLEGQPTTAFPAGAALPSVALRMTPSNYDFPAGAVAPSTSGPVGPMSPRDQRATLVGPYTSPYSALHSYDFYPQTRIAPCIIMNGGPCYAGTYNYYDPDTFLSTSALLHARDPLLVSAAKGLIETNLRFLCSGSVPGQSCEEGQAMHHFTPSCDKGNAWCWCTADPIAPSLNVCVSYAALSGAIQTGPNIFQTWSFLRIAAATGDLPWLASLMPTIRRSLAFLLRRLDAGVSLFKVPGSLMIDTFIRANYTADTQAAMVLLLERAADAEGALGNSSGAALYSGVAAAVRAASAKYLLAPSGDHLCTQSDPLPGGGVHVCSRDFVDYDSNLLAIAAGILTGPTAEATLARIDSGACTHSRATWVSEVYYDAANCNIGNTGDSAISMGRISWLDGLARRAVGTPAALEVLSGQVVAPLVTDLLAQTWQYERYTCQGKPTHSPFYIEMPEVVAMLQVEAVYGLDLFSWSTLTVDPVPGLGAFTYAPLGDADVVISHDPSGAFYAAVPLVTPAQRAVRVTGMAAGTYTLTGATTGSATVGADGVLTFAATLGAGRVVTATRQAA